MIVGMLCSNITFSQGSGGVISGESTVKYNIIPNATSTYQWFVIGGNFDGASTGPFVTINWLANQKQYKVGVLETAVTGCKGDTVWHEIDNGKIIFPHIFGKRLVCEGENVTLTASASDTVFQDIYYRWSTGQTDQTISLNIYQKTSLYCVVYYNGDAIDTAYITIDVMPIPKPDFSWYPSFPKLGDEVVFTFNSNTPFDYHWIFNGKVDTNAGNEFRVIMDSSGLNKVGLYMKNDLGCDNTKFYSFNIDNGYLFLIPEAFSPNGDGVNDVFKIEAPEGLKSCEIRIFNRWGQILYKSNDMNNISWDGKFNNEIVADGGYVVQVVAYALNNKYIYQNATVSVLR